MSTQSVKPLYEPLIDRGLDPAVVTELERIAQAIGALQAGAVQPIYEQPVAERGGMLAEFPESGSFYPNAPNAPGIYYRWYESLAAGVNWSMLNNNGRFQVVTKADDLNSPYTVDDWHTNIVFADTTNGDVEITLPAANYGRYLQIKKASSDSNEVIITPAAGDSYHYPNLTEIRLDSQDTFIALVAGSSRNWLVAGDTPIPIIGQMVATIAGTAYTDTTTYQTLQGYNVATHELAMGVNPAGAAFTVPTGEGGTYQMLFSGTFGPLSRNLTYEYTLHINGVAANLTGAFSVLNNQDYVNASLSGYLSLAGGDVVDMRSRVTSGTGNHQMQSSQFSLRRVGNG